MLVAAVVDVGPRVPGCSSCVLCALTGFCDHESFAAVGMAVPDRVNLFRMQAMRGMGGNSRRMSHNPPAPSLLDLTGELGCPRVHVCTWRTWGVEGVGCS